LGRAAAASLSLGLAACATPDQGPAVKVEVAAPDNPALYVDTAPSDQGFAVFDPATVIQDDWAHLPLHGTTDYRMAFVDGRLAIRAQGRRSASGLIRRVTIDPARCPELEWSWRVEHLQPGADLRMRQGDDVAASIFLLFGDPGFLTDPDPVPTLRYVWTNAQLAQEAVIDSPYMPGLVRSLVIENGGGRLGAWVTERRDIAADYWRAFGRAPSAPVNAVVIFTDNDQTGEPVLAHYGRAQALCTP
jgi:hypothetical protein